MGWDCTVKSIKNLVPIDGADSIELAIVGENWPCVVGKGSYKAGDLVSYVPADSIVPDSVLALVGLEGKLSNNRVKAIRLKGQISIGILLPVPPGFNEDDSVANHYGITKYEQPIPTHLAGKQRHHPPIWEKYDIENIKNANPFTVGEMVVLTEKLHGSCFNICYVNGEIFVSSKNVTLVEDDTNTYWRIAKEYQLTEKVKRLATFFNVPADVPIYLYGEIFGKGIQDLTYGTTKPNFAAFDIRIGHKYVDFDLFLRACRRFQVPTVPILTSGPYSLDFIQMNTTGTEIYSGQNLHIREGIVVKPLKERTYGKHGERAIFKSVSPDYMTRKGGTEFQ